MSERNLQQVEILLADVCGMPELQKSLNKFHSIRLRILFQVVVAHKFARQFMSIMIGCRIKKHTENMAGMDRKNCIFNLL